MNFESFMLELIRQSNSKNDFQNYYNQLDTAKKKIWDKLINYLNDHFGIQGSNRLIYNSQINSSQDNFFRYLSEKIDLSNYDLTNIQSDDPTSTNRFWNESIAELIDYYNQYINDTTSESTDNEDRYSVVNGKIPIGSNTFNTEDIKNADAGNSFDEIAQAIPKWVRPWYNAERYNNSGFRSYYDVRNLDISPKAVSNDKNIEFTRTKNDSIIKWLRLLMPNNSRRVEVEDLNRNFWVISSTLTGVVGYLFDDNSPFKKILKGALSELLELWENILYLWAGMAMVSQSNNGFKTVMLPIPNSEWQCYNKYDGFTTITDSTTIQNRVKFLKYLYSGYNLIIISFNRDDNYYRNQYAAQSYPCVIFYNNTTDTFKTTTLKDTNNNAVSFVPGNYSDRLFAIRETDTYYKYSYPIEHMNEVIDEGQSLRYFAGLRIIPDIEAVINNNGKIEVKKFQLKGIDAARKAIRNEDYVIVEYNKVLGSWTEDSETFNLNKTTSEIDIEGYYDIYRTAVSQALYFCEFPTTSALSQGRPDFILYENYQIIGSGQLIRIGNFLPANFYTLPVNDTKYYQRANYYAEQKAPNGVNTTDYLLNLTITGPSNTSDVSTIYGGLGAGHVVPCNDCFLFTPKVNGQGNCSLECSQTKSQDLDENNYKQLGFNVIKDYIINDTRYDTITYFIAAVGIQPWHNNPANEVFQGYWANTMLTHMFRYIPNEFKNYITDEEYNNAEKVEINGKEIGAIELLGKINKQEKAFSVDGGAVSDTFYIPQNKNTSWRLPQLMPEETIQGYIRTIERYSRVIYFVNYQADANLLTAYNNDGAPGVINYLNAHYQEYMDNTNILMTAENIKIELSSPSGKWAVFDGYSTDKGVSQPDTYKNDSDQREVAYTSFSFVNNNLSLTNSYGRAIGTNSFSSIDSTIILPGGSANMVYTW